MADILNKEEFTVCINKDFQVVPQNGAAPILKLTEVIEQFKTSRQEAFSVMFHGPAEQFLQQGTYKLKNEQLGEIDLFLVPVAQDRDGFQYEAAFNHLIPQTQS